jgi:cysteine synthase A
MASAIVESVLSLIGETPMVRLRRLVTARMSEVAVKLESYNPGGSVKDRIALAMIEAAEREGKLQPGDTIVEPTSGNTGIGLALVAAVKGYRLIITMPDDVSSERQVLLRNYGAEVVLTPARRLMQGAVERARQIVAENPRCFMPHQFANPANPEIHRQTTAREILSACEGKLDAFVAGIGTGGTITGVGEVLKHARPGLLVVGVEPSASPVLSGGRPGRHDIQGIGAGFVPPVLARHVLDEVLTCTAEAAFDVSRRLAREEGISAGISAGAAVWGALRVAERLGPDRRVVTVLPDAFDRYATVARPRSSLDFVI